MDGAVLLDTGLAGEPWLIRRKLARLGLKPSSVRAILLTHGHIDHAGNLAWAREWTGAPIHAHPLEQQHIDGTYPYAGANRWCGRLERAGRALLRVGAPAPIDAPFADGDELPFWGGLRVVHLPGHTLGHCGFYSRRHDLLFSGKEALSAGRQQHQRLDREVRGRRPPGVATRVTIRGAAAGLTNGASA